MKKRVPVIILNANRNGYGIEQIHHTMTVKELIEYLSDFNDDTRVYFGNDPQSRYNGWYTYGSLGDSDIIEGWCKYDEDGDLVDTEFNCDTAWL